MNNGKLNEEQIVYALNKIKKIGILSEEEISKVLEQFYKAYYNAEDVGNAINKIINKIGENNDINI